MAIRATLECGHSSVLRSRSTPEGYTHDWEVFVRGVNNADIQQYIEKVVFHLHETFPKPKRVLKEPPYVVKESGYAGFVIPINIYLRNKDEPKKFQIHYDLQLQPSGPAINTVIRHNEVFINPSDDFKKKLLKGGATHVINSEGTSDKNESKTTPPMVSKPKLSGSEGKKHRLSELKASNTFDELFGPPIKTAKVSPDNKKASSDKTVNSKITSATEKGDRVEKAAKVKHSPHKDTKKEKNTDEKKEKKDKEKESSKERDKNKDKSKRPLSPNSKNNHLSPKSKRTISPVPVKKPPSPAPISAKRPPSPKPKEKDLSKKVVSEKEKEKSKDTLKTITTNTTSSEDQKSDRKKEKKKHKEDRDKEKKDKHKDKDREKNRDSIKSGEKKVEKQEKSGKEKSQEPKPPKEEKKSPKPVKEPEKPKDEKFPKLEKTEKVERAKETKEKSEKEKSKHKHKKKDKKEKRDGSKDREKKEKREKTKSSNEKQNSMNSVPTSNPLSTLLTEMPDRDSSDSAHSVDEDSCPAVPVKKELSSPPVSEMSRPMSPPVMQPNDIKKEKGERHKRDRSKASRGEDRENRKKKRRSEGKAEEEIVKREKLDRDHSSSPLVEPVSSSQSPIAMEINSTHQVKDERDLEEQLTKKGSEGEAEQVAPDSTNSTLVDAENLEPPVFSDDYVSQLKDLQHKIMTLQDNQELQRVVQVIAETGQYEITKKTFDFDLCALDRRTVQRLQQFFAS